MSGGWSRLTREASTGHGFDGCVVIMYAALAFPFAMLGLASAAEWIGGRYGTPLGLAVFLAPAWLPVTVGLIAAKVRGDS